MRGFDKIRTTRRRSARHPTAFISYAQSSRAWQATVLRFTIALRTQGGVDAEIDLFRQASNERWSTFGPNSIESADYTLVVVDATFKRRWTGRDEPGVGAGVAREAAAIRALFDRDQVEFVRRVKVVLLPGADLKDIPDDLHDCERYPIESFDLAGMEVLLRSVYGKPAFPKPEIGEIPSLPPKAIASLEGTAPAASEVVPETIEQGDDAAGIDAEATERLKDRLRETREELDGSQPSSAAARDDLRERSVALEVSIDALEQARSDRARRRMAARQWLVLAAAAVLAVVGAGVVARALAGNDGSPAKARTVKVSGLELKEPSGWRARRGAPGVLGLEIKRPVILASTRTSKSEAPFEVVAGVSGASGSTLLPPVYRHEVGERTEREAVQLRSLQAYRYRGLTTASGKPLTAFVAPTSIGTVTLACWRSSGQMTNADLRLCAQIASTVRLRRGSGYALGASAAFGQALRKQFGQLRERLRKNLARMGKAKTAADQADAAFAIADAYRDAAHGLAAVQITPQSADGQASMVAALRRTREGYLSLADAARGERPASYADDKRALATSEALARDRQAALRKLGYEVRSRSG
jgi:hypothetical protein